MKNVTILLSLIFVALPVGAQRMLSLDSCRAMALRNNKQLGISKLKQDVARDTRKAARTKYLPHVDVLGGYEFTSREISILSDKQKGAIGSIGTTAAGQIGNTISSVISEMAGQGIITPQAAEALGNIAGKIAPGIEQAGNAIGKTSTTLLGQTPVTCSLRRLWLRSLYTWVEALSRLTRLPR